MITDAMGNELREGQKLYWKQADLFVTVRGVTVVQQGKVTIAALKLELDMGVPVQGESAQFPMFIRVVDPAAEAIVEKAMGAR